MEISSAKRINKRVFVSFVIIVDSFLSLLLLFYSVLNYLLGDN